MKFDRHSLMALSLGAVLSFGTTACSRDRSANRDRNNEGQTASQPSDTATPRTDEETTGAAGTGTTGTADRDKIGGSASTDRGGASATGRVGDRTVTGRVGTQKQTDAEKRRRERERNNP